MKALDVQSLVICEIKENGKYRGCIGFCECNYKRKWTDPQINTMLLLSKIIGVFLIKNRKDELLIKASYENELAKYSKTLFSVFDEIFEFDFDQMNCRILGSKFVPEILV